MYAYPSPGQNEARVRQQALARNPEGGAELAQSAVDNRANRYAQMRMMQMRKLSQMLQGQQATDFGNQMQMTQGLDPQAAWRMISGHFAQLANQSGFQDPRMFLAQQMRQGRGMGME